MCLECLLNARIDGALLAAVEAGVLPLGRDVDRPRTRDRCIQPVDGFLGCGGGWGVGQLRGGWLARRVWSTGMGAIAVVIGMGGTAVVIATGLGGTAVDARLLDRQVHDLLHDPPRLLPREW